MIKELIFGILGGLGQCQVLSGVVFLDMVSNFEEIGDYLTNITQAVIEGLQWNGS